MSSLGQLSELQRRLEFFDNTFGICIFDEIGLVHHDNNWHGQQGGVTAHPLQLDIAFGKPLLVTVRVDGENYCVYLVEVMLPEFCSLAADVPHRE